MPPADGTAGSIPEEPELRRTSRDREALRGQLQEWLAGVLPSGSVPTVYSIEPPSATGMSSDTVLFDASWNEGDGRRMSSLVARVAPDAADVPVFPRYDLAAQYRTIAQVAGSTSVPVPPLKWLEEDPGAIGAPFFVMERVEGRVPPDVMPYNFGDSWLFDASPKDQKELQESTIAAIAALHAIDDPLSAFGFLVASPGGGGDATSGSGGDTTPAGVLARHVAGRKQWYEFVAACGERSPLIDRAFGWLELNFPSGSDLGNPVFSWGDARIGNVVYDGFEPAAVLDWEMAGVGPRELDIGWLIYAHRVFEDMAAQYGLTGMPEFLRPADVASSYESLTGWSPRRLEFFMTYAAVQFAVVFLRTGQRAVHFGERTAPGDVDEFLYNREPLDEMISGLYWKDL